MVRRDRASVGICGRLVLHGMCGRYVAGIGEKTIYGITVYTKRSAAEIFNVP